MIGHLTRSVRSVGARDRKLIRRTNLLPPTRADAALLRLTRSANKSRLWWVVSVPLLARKGPTRRGALRGIAAIGAASAAANLLGKPLFPRRRPAAEEVPVYRRLIKRPESSSFPSGHSASAAAFTTAVAMESPAAGLAVAPIALAVAYSRVHTGVHWPSDVGAGAAIGVAAAFATRHWWPLRTGIAATGHRADVPPMRDGERMLAFVNPGSGDNRQDPTDDVRFAWPKATILYPEQDQDIRTQLTTALAERDGEVEALAVAGGDGTVAAVASVAADHGLPLALIPAGTLNHFARDVGVGSMADADAATEAGAAVGIDLGEVEISWDGGADRRWFVNTAGLGGYPEMVQLRERLQAKMPKWRAGVLAMIRTLRRARPIPVLLNGKPAMIWMLFVGNGGYHPKGFAPTSRPALDTGMLDVRYLRADVPYSRARFVAATLTNTLNASHVYREYETPYLEVELREDNRRIATDGETGPLGNRFVFRSRHNALRIYRRP